jgi:hypothetical protein
MGSTNRIQVLRLRGLQIALLALAAASVCRAQQPATTPAAGADPSAQAPVAVAQVPPDAPVLAPRVVCKGDQITISANNSTLSSVLEEVHRCMGTKIDLPDGAGEKRMFDRIGPGPASQVLDELLSNTGYNYIIGSSPANQEKIESIMLLARNTTDAGAGLTSVTDSRNLSANRRAFLQMHQSSIPHPMTDADTAAAAAAAAAAAEVATPAPAEATPTPAPASTDAQPTAPPADQKPAETAPVVPDTPPTAPPPNVTEINGKPATTDDQINNMQQMFELRKQMNQPPSSTPPPQ